MCLEQLLEVSDCVYLNIYVSACVCVCVCVCVCCVCVVCVHVCMFMCGGGGGHSGDGDKIVICLWAILSRGEGIHIITLCLTRQEFPGVLSGF